MITSGMNKLHEILQNTMYPGQLVSAFGNNECFWPAIVTPGSDTVQWMIMSRKFTQFK